MEEREAERKTTSERQLERAQGLLEKEEATRPKFLQLPKCRCNPMPRLLDNNSDSSFEPSFYHSVFALKYFFGLNPLQQLPEHQFRFDRESSPLD